MMYKVKSGFILRTIGGQIMAIPVGVQTSNMHGMIALTESGELLWNALCDGAEENALCDLLMENYEIDQPTALEDVKSFIKGLKEQGALE